MDPCHLKIVKKNDRFPSFKRPVIIGFYSTDRDRRFSFSSKNMKYFYRPNKDGLIDLNIGFEEYIPKIQTMENEEKIDSVLLWLYHSKYLHHLLPSEDASSTFVCFRGLLTTIMRTPYETQEDWFISAIKIKNIIFLCSFYTDDKKAKIQKGQTMKEKRFEFWGRKFEQYVLTDDPGKKPNFMEQLDANEEFSLVLRSNLHGHKLIYGAETDGFMNKKMRRITDAQLKTAECSDFVELKTSRIIDNEHQDRNFKKFKLLKWWSQSFMVGIEKIVCGFRNDNGIVRSLQDFRVADIPCSTKQFWSPCVCMRFLDDFLSFVKKIMENEANLSQWRFDWKPGCNHVTASKMPQSPDYKIIPEWFFNECKQFLLMSK